MIKLKITLKCNIALKKLERIKLGVRPEEMLMGHSLGRAWKNIVKDLVIEK